MRLRGAITAFGVALISLSASVSTAPVAMAAQPQASGKYVHLHAGLVNVRNLPAPKASARHSLSPHVRNNTVFGEAKRARTPSTATKVTLAAARRPQAPVAPVPLSLISHDAEHGLSANYDISPPDTQVAAGPVSLLEFVNVAGGIWSKQGVQLSPLFDLNSFFGVPNNLEFYDPRVLYDPSIGRWIASGASANLAASPSFTTGEIYIAVSATADPGGNWYFYSDVAGDSPNGDPVLKDNACDQPKIGYSIDKIAISCSLFNQTTFTGELALIFNKAQLAAGSSAPDVYEVGPDNTVFGVVPATSLTFTNTLWMAYNLGEQHGNTTTDWIGVIKVTGNPAARTVAFTASQAPLSTGTGTHVPPPALQPPQGTLAAPPIETDDDRLLSAVVRGDALWTSANDSCQGVPSAVACLRLFRINVSGPSPTVNKSILVSSGTSSYAYYPALMLDQRANLFVAYSQSSTTQWPSAEVGQSTADSIENQAPSFASAEVQAGTGDYVMSGTVPASGSRWGDYSAAAPDPCQDNVWASAEYSASPSATTSNNWGTATESVWVPPSVPSHPQWFRFQCLGGSMISSPDAASWANGRLDVFAVGPNHDLIHTWFDNDSWHAWQSLGGYVVGDPGSVSWSHGDGTNRLDVFVRGGDNQLWHKWWDGSNWSAWQPLGGILSSGVDVSSWANGRLDVFIRSTDTALWHKWWDGRSWSVWQRLGGQLSADPSAVSWGPNRIDVFVRGIDNQLWHKWWDGIAWSGWEPQFGPPISSGPDVSSWAPGRLDVFAEGPDQGLRQKFWDGTGWSTWDPRGGWMGSDPTAVSQTTNQVDVFFRGPDGELMATSYK